MFHNRHFIPGASTVVSLFGAITASDAAAWGGALTAFVATVIGIIWDQIKKREQLRIDRAKADHELKVEKAKAHRAEQWSKYCLKRRMEAIDAGHADPFPNGLPMLEPDEEHEPAEAK